jgi:hypothetical protein
VSLHVAFIYLDYLRGAVIRFSVFFAVLNAPGSLHDSTLAEWGVESVQNLKACVTG